MLHLLHTRKQDIPSNKPSNAFRTRRTRQTPFIRPEFIEHIHLLQYLQKVHFHPYTRRVVKPRDGWELREECRRSVSWVDSNG
jgi:hypothetical protein